MIRRARAPGRDAASRDLLRVELARRRGCGSRLQTLDDARDVARVSDLSREAIFRAFPFPTTTISSKRQLSSAADIPPHWSWASDVPGRDILSSGRTL